MIGGCRAALSLFTIAPVRVGPDERPAALRWALLPGLLLGGIAAGLVVLGRWLYPGGSLLTGALVMAALAGLTRGLHLDGLADTADGFGAPGRALAVMREPDVGPFGVAAVVVVLLVEVAALTRSISVGRGAAAVVVAVVTGRLAMLAAGVPGVPAARPDGLGALVAGSVPRWLPVALLVVVLGGAALPAGLGRPGLAGRLDGAIAAGFLAGWALRRRAVRRFGGVTGDVFGAIGEVATAAALVVSALR